MSRTSPRRRLAAYLVLLIAMAGPSGVSAAAIAWAQRGSFEACLDSALEPWIAKQAELVVNGDEGARRVDDALVAAWTVDTLARCRTPADASAAASEERFTKHMAQWRKHIYDLAASIRQKGQSD